MMEMLINVLKLDCEDIWVKDLEGCFKVSKSSQ